jgi:hypothetical protein
MGYVQSSCGVNRDLNKSNEDRRPGCGGHFAKRIDAKNVPFHTDEIFDLQSIRSIGKLGLPVGQADFDLKRAYSPFGDVSSIRWVPKISWRFAQRRYSG